MLAVVPDFLFTEITGGIPLHKGASFCQGTLEIGYRAAMTIHLRLFLSAFVILAGLISGCSQQIRSATGLAGVHAPTQQILAEIKAQGAKAVVRRLESPGEKDRWEKTLREIQTGSAEWVKVARELLKGSDAGMTEDIYQSLAIALTNNPEPVLSLVDDVVPMSAVCTVPYIEAKPGKVAAHKKRALEALQKVSRTDLISKRDACTKAIQQIE